MIKHNIFRYICCALIAGVVLLFLFIFIRATALNCTHAEVSINVTTPATCLNNGVSEVSCSKCNEVLQINYINPIGHNYSEFTVSVMPTSERDGVEMATCNNCGDTIERNIPYTYVSSRPDITFSYEYFTPDDLMPYGLITPSSFHEGNKLPLIVSLHGMSELNCSESKFESRFVINLMKNWELECFNAYVLFPHLAGNGYSSSWNDKRSANNVFSLIDFIVNKYNINTDKIIIQGHSMGAYGCMYMAACKPNFFSAIVPISPYASNVNLNKIKGIPFRCYVGNNLFGEDGSCVKFTNETISSKFGEETIFRRDVSHNEIPVVAYAEDLNGDNKSDLIEWMLAQSKFISAT